MGTTAKDNKPLYCPRAGCRHHSLEGHGVFYYRNGHYKNRSSGKIIQRYICKYCGKQFSDQTFSMDYWKRYPNLNESIFFLRVNGMTNRSIAQFFKHSEHFVRDRLADMARQGLIRENILSQKFIMNESIIYDGFETFVKTQFSPCYINTAVGEDSFYTYATTYSPLNRKGKMTPQQKTKKLKQEKEHGKYPTDSIRQQTTYILRKLLKYCSDEQLVLISDKHKAYRNAIKFDLKNKKISHQTISSKRPRTCHNPLFPVNHLHMTKRHFNSAHRRETIAFHKNEAGIIDTITLNRIDKNFMKGKFTKGNPHDPMVHKRSPAMLAGITSRIFSFDDFFDYRRHGDHACFDEQEWNQYRRVWEYSRFKIVPYCGK